MGYLQRPVSRHQSALTLHVLWRIGQSETAVPRFGTRVADRTAPGEVAAMSLYAGESIGDVKRVIPAREIIRELVEEAEQLLRRPR